MATGPASTGAAGRAAVPVTGPPAGSAFDAVILAGGTGRRLGGAAKPEVALHGRRLLDHALDAAAGARRVVVVAPPEVAVPAGVTRTLEDPPHGGPAAGIAAGLAALGPAPASAVLVLACDVPGAAGAVPRLLAAALGTDGDGDGDMREARPAAGACLVDDSGREQWLVAVYRTGALREALAAEDVRDVPVRAVARRLALLRVPALPGEATDVDTWEQLRDLEGRAGHDKAPPLP